MAWKRENTSASIEIMNRIAHIKAKALEKSRENEIRMKEETGTFPVRMSNDETKSFYRRMVGLTATAID